tara:strand:- start:376 stop:1170 length:795 start_codon:yes stop_codon:yes gene_type:complete
MSLSDQIRNLDYNRETSSTSEKAGRRGSGQKGGSGIGGLLGPLLLTAITGGAAAPWMLALAGAGGAFLGGKAGGAMSGVSQDDIDDGKFNLKSKIGIHDDLAKAQLSDSIKSGIGGFMGAADINKFGTGFKAGSAGGEGLLKNFMGGMKGGAESYFNKVPYNQVEGMEGNILKNKDNFNILDVVNRVKDNPELATNIVTNPSSVQPFQGPDASGDFYNSQDSSYEIEDYTDVTNTDVPGAYVSTNQKPYSGYKNLLQTQFHSKF